MRDHPQPEAGFLERLFPSLSRDAFLSNHWPGELLWEHGPLERLGLLTELPALGDLALLLGEYRDRVRVALPDKRDEHSFLKVDALTAAALHRNGMALILNKVERFFPIVEQWLLGLRVELGLPQQCEPRSIIYVTPVGAGNSPHFDANANFVVQLRGTKRWHLAPNRSVRHPTDRFAINQQAPSAELAGYLEGPLPTGLPDDAQSVELSPGSVLFVPRGSWHATEADEDTLALNFTFAQPTWADVALTALRTQLLQDAGWRALAVGLCSPDAKRAEAGRSELLERLSMLREEVERLDATRIVQALDVQPGYLLAPEGFLRVEDGAVLVSLGEDEFELEAQPHLHPVLEWIGEQGGPFFLAQVSAHFPQLAAELPELFQQLQDRGLLERHQDGPEPASQREI